MGMYPGLPVMSDASERLQKPRLETRVHEIDAHGVLRYVASPPSTWMAAPVM